jgi:hypothetical protein
MQAEKANHVLGVRNTGRKKCLDVVTHSQDTPLNILWYDMMKQPLCSRVRWTSSF